MSKLYLSKINKETLYIHKDGRKFLNIAIWLNDQPDKKRW